MSQAQPAVWVAQQDGAVSSQNIPARRLLGEGRGTTCWELVGGLAKADALGLSESTVRTHVEKMLTKLDASNRAALVAMGFRLGYLE